MTVTSLSQSGLVLRRVAAAALALALGMAFALPALAQESGGAATGGPEPAKPAPAGGEPGVVLRLYNIGDVMDLVPPIAAGQAPNVCKVAPAVDFDGARGDFAPLRDQFVSHVEGVLTAPSTGKYTLRLISDDGSNLYVDGRRAIDHDGLHSAAEPAAVKIDLAAGPHALRIEHFQMFGEARLLLEWQPPGAADFTPVPASALTHPADVSLATAPGRKKLGVLPIPGAAAVDQQWANTRPGDTRPLRDVHPAFDLKKARPQDFRPKVGGLDFLPDGRMVITTWDPIGAVYFLSNVAGDDPDAITVHRFAAGLAEPLGVKVVEGRIFVLQKQELTELIDHDGDGVADEYRCVCSGWNVTANFHEFAFGLVYKDGFFYANLAVAINPGGATTVPQVQGRGCVLRISAKDGTFQAIAGGLRTPNGIGLGVDGEIFITDNQGDWLPSSKLLHVKPGRFFNSYLTPPGPFEKQPITPPVVWLPHGEIGNSPSNPVLVEKGAYAGQMLHGDVTHGGVKRVFVEKVNGEYQGCVFRFTQGLEAGVNRIAWGPDGSLYVGGIGSTGNWGQTGKRRYGLERLTPNGKTAFEMLAVRARQGGFEIEMTEPFADPDLAGDPANYRVEQWRYKPTTSYGGPKIDRTVMAVKAVSLSPDLKTAALEIDGLKESYVAHLRLSDKFRSATDQRLWTTEGWYTLNAIPAGLPVTKFPPPPPIEPNTLTAAEKRQGWKLLFDGRTTAGWRGFRKKIMPSGWKVDEGCLTRVGLAGDIVTEGQFENFDLRLEWKVAPGGNSGIFFRVSEDLSPCWHTGPEMQVLDNARHADGKNPLTSAGSAYALYAPAKDVAKPAGEFNRARLLVDGAHVEHWLNGEKIVAYELGGDDWLARVKNSKFASMPRFGREKQGHLALQDHGDRVAFRDVKIRVLPSRESGATPPKAEKEEQF
ncbi:MAG: DUF1080 domain-containing protein [Planctomycetes bacterium]|nr:DUF1080 domain-containing protein [Planctomycetota bacterium]